MAASRKILRARRPNYFSTSPGHSSSLSYSDNPLFELDESDVWPSSSTEPISTTPFEPRPKAIPIPRSLPKKLASSRMVSDLNIHHYDRTNLKHAPAAATSLPMHIPDWSKIQPWRTSTRAAAAEGDNDDEDGDDDGMMAPPHEYLARRRGASFSVQEGAGRTLKGMDLCRVRNEIWKRVGFED